MNKLLLLNYFIKFFFIDFLKILIKLLKLCKSEVPKSKINQLLIIWCINQLIVIGHLDQSVIAINWQVFFFKKEKNCKTRTQSYLRTQTKFFFQLKVKQNKTSCGDEIN